MRCCIRCRFVSSHHPVFVQRIADQKKLPSIDELVHTQSVVRVVFKKISRSQYNEDHGYGGLDPSINFDDDTKLLKYLYEELEIYLREQ